MRLNSKEKSKVRRVELGLKRYYLIFTGKTVKTGLPKVVYGLLAGFILLAIAFAPSTVPGADRLVGLYSSRVMSQSMPWIAQEAGLFQKYNLDFQLVFIASSGMATGRDPGSVL